ncbi:winged helix-turn-helix transcriptional regulator [Mucilaginibacter pedocola]|uniref:HTH hxlR-type domain-containing protein n=1 Tax=Mucilaginibacter pedocola TaxID=1792845 RepID=A0A1S9P6M2_9SPHI|nr:hypothetical protein BC343_19465 [Mucilaginibacter pedocola]
MHPSVSSITSLQALKRSCAQLRELEHDGIIARVIYPEVPPKVKYFTTELGKTMHNVINAMGEWGNMYRTVAEQKAFVQLPVDH